MAEGGMFPWKMQKIWSRAPTGNFSNLRDPLPKVPAGMTWHQDMDTKEWKLVKEEENEEEHQRQQESEAEKVIEKLDVFSASDKEPEPELADEEQELDRDKMVDTLPPLPPNRELHSNQLQLHNYNEDEWELLSDRVSCSSHGGTIFVSRAGSVRSISSMDGSHGHGDPNYCLGSGSFNTTLSVPFKIQRTHSSSTLDSTDNVLGPSGLGVLGVDYVEHVILPTDTLQGICIGYKINSTRLRQANHFSGNSLLLAPKKLVIPISKKALRSGFIRVQDTDAKEYKLHAFLAEFADLSLTEAKAYLELDDWVLKDAVRSAREDNEWEQDIDANELKSGEIRFTMNKMGLHAAGAGIRKNVEAKVEVKDEKKPVIIAYEGIPAIATKTVKAQDVYMAAQQHDNVGLEMKPLMVQKESAIATSDTVKADDVYKPAQHQDNVGLEMKPLC